MSEGSRTGEGLRKFLLRVAVSGSLLLVLAFAVDVSDVAVRLRRMDLRWVALGLVVSLGQVLVSAWRWRFTASRLGVGLPMGTAVAEYYLATFLNQLLPGGVLGDVSRAWRHARTARVDADGSADGGLRSIHAVVLERASGQVVMVAVAASAAVILLAPRTGWTLPRHPLGETSLAVTAAVVTAGVAVVVAMAWLLVRQVVHVPAFGRFLEHARRALLGSALPVQLALSLVIVGSYVVVFVVAARAVGVSTPWNVLAPLIPPLLVTMLVPVSVAGWGVREGAAALLWGAVGLTATEGVAVSVAYGLLVLVSSLPGAVVVLLTLRSEPDPDPDPDRRAGRSPDGSAGRPAGEPGRATPPSGG